MPSLVELFAVFIVFMSQMAGLSAVPMPLPHARRDGLETRVHSHSNIQARVVERYTETAITKRQENQDDADEDKPRECNGWAELCDRKYGNVTFLGSHDSFADSPHMYALSRTQEVPLEKQMELGARMLQAQSHLVNGELHFCHTSCFLFDGGTVAAYLAKVKKFMDENPNEVFTFVFTNPKLLSIEQYWKPVFEKSGLDKMAYIPPKPIMSRDDWPTLGEMIDSGRRLVVFMDKGADNRTHPENEYILPQFRMMWEDPHNPVDSAFPCSVDRTKGPLLPTDQLYLINHNLNINMLPIGKSGFKLPDRLNSPRSNGFSSIMHHAADCARDVMEGRNPNFVMLDYVNVGFGMIAVDALNGLGDWAKP